MSRNRKRTSDGVRVDRLPGVGTRYEVGTIDGQRLTVVIDRRGDRHLGLRSDRQDGAPGVSAVLSARQSRLVALILSDTFEITEGELLEVAAAA